MSTAVAHKTFLFYLNVLYCHQAYESIGDIISKILLIEDNYQNAVLMKRILEARQHQVIHASDGESGLKTAIEEVPDIVLVDLGLPDIEGQTLVGLVRRVPELKDVPIVAVTAWPEATAREMARAYGCDGYISKPINARIFPDQIAKFISGD